MPRKRQTPHDPRKRHSGARRTRAGTDRDRPAANPFVQAPSGALSTRAFWLTLAGLCLAGLLLRAVIFSEYVQKNPIAEQPWTDGLIYWLMAERMASGEWIGDTPFLSAPLYPYFLGVVRALGGGLISVYVTQTFMHLITAVLIACGTRIRFGPVAGLVAAGLFLALTEPAMWSSRIMAGTLQLLLVALLWWRWAALAEHESQRWREVVVVGLLIGVFALSYPAGVLLAPVYAAWLWWTGGRRVAATGRALAGLACAVVTIAPATLHNAWVGGEFIPITAHAGITMLHGNAEAAQGIRIPVAGISQTRRYLHESAAQAFRRAHGRDGTWREIDRWFRGFVYEFWTEQPWLTAKLFARKFYWFVSARNYSSLMPIVLEREYGVARRAILAPLPTPWLLGAALAALLVLLRRPVRFAPEWVLLAVPVLVVILFFYNPRYRLPTVPVLCGLAAGALVHFRRLRYPKSLCVGLCLLPLVLSGVNHAVGFDTPDFMRASYAPLLSTAHVEAGDRRLAEGRIAAAERSYRAALGVLSDNGMARRRLGALYARKGQAEDALAEFGEALRCFQSFHYFNWEYERDLTYRHLYNVYVQLRHYSEAVAALRQAVSAHPGYPETRLALAWLLATFPDETLRNGDQAVQHAEAARRLIPQADAETFDVLAAAYAEAGRFQQAVEAASTALELARRNGRDRLAAEIEYRLLSYRDGQPCRARARLMYIPPSPG